MLAPTRKSLIHGSYGTNSVCFAGLTSAPRPCPVRRSTRRCGSIGWSTCWQARRGGTRPPLPQASRSTACGTRYRVTHQSVRCRTTAFKRAQRVVLFERVDSPDGCSRVMFDRLIMKVNVKRLKNVLTRFLAQSPQAVSGASSTCCRTVPLVLQVPGGGTPSHCCSPSRNGRTYIHRGGPMRCPQVRPRRRKSMRSSLCLQNQS